MYLFKISTKVDSVWSTVNPKALYIIATSKESAHEWAMYNLRAGLTVSKIVKLADQVSGIAFVSS